MLCTPELKRYNYLCSEIDALYHEASFRLGLSDSAMQILYAICNNGGGSCPLHEICRLSGIRKQTLNSALRKLEKENLIFLTAQTGRKKLVTLTEAGRQLAGRTAVRLISLENEIFRSWSPEDQQEYLRLTQKYLTAFRAKVDTLPCRTAESHREIR